MNELAWRHHLPIISLCEVFLDAQLTLWSDLAEIQTFILCMSSLPASIKKITWKATEVEIVFSHHKSMGALCYHGNLSCDPICSKMQPFPNPKDATDRF